MGRSLFVTGASGFVGSHFLNLLPLAGYERVVCLSRTNGQPPCARGYTQQIQYLRGDILDPTSYESELASTDTVVHLAALTGKAKRSAHFKINGEGTRVLVATSKRLGVKHFLHVSTISVTYENLRFYYYAQSKQLAEAFVREGGLPYAIIRPTIVLAQDAPVWLSLKKMASGNRIVIPGNGTALIQPIDVDDLAACMVRILEEGLFQGQSYDLGGPDRLSFESFLRQIRDRLGEGTAQVVHLPLGAMRTCLMMLERGLGILPPVTAGQLAAFGNDGLASDNELMRNEQKKMKSIREMIEVLTRG